MANNRQPPLSTDEQRRWHDYVEELGKQALAAAIGPRQWLDQNVPTIQRLNELFYVAIDSFPPDDRAILNLMFPRDGSAPLSLAELKARTGRSETQLGDLAVAVAKASFALRNNDAEYQQLLTAARQQVIGR